MKTKLPSTIGIRHSAFAAFVAALALFTTSPRAPAQTVWSNALSFDGVNDYVQIADTDPLDLTNNYTLECWFNAGSFGSLRGLVGKYHTPNANGYLLRLTGTNLDFDAMTTTGLNLQTGVWYHVAAVNSNSTRRLYLNGQSKTLSGTALTTQVNTNPLCLGADYLKDNNRFFNGQMDEVRIWNVARSQAEIQANMRHPLTGNESNLVAYYRLDEGTGLTAYDATTNHFDGTLVNSPTWVLSTVPAAPVVSLGFLSGLTTVSAGLCGLVNPGSLPTTVWFEWGATTNYGSTTSNAVLSAANVPVEICQPISGLTPGTTYHFRTVATNALGVATGNNLTFQTAWPTARYVNAASTNATPPYTNWNIAATNMQDAVNAALSFDEIVVTNGAYDPVSVTQPLALRSVNGPAVTLINGAGVTNCVVLASGASLSGFTLTNGFASAGGGVYCAASATVSNCVLTGNSATSGGGTFASGLNNCVLTGNSATQYGGGARSSTLNNCVLTGNSAATWGGGGAFASTLNNCTVTGNSAGRYGGGTARSTCNNCILYFNTAPTGANYILFYQAGESMRLNYCCTTPQPLGGVGNITLDPALAGVSHLSANSPCRGAGSAAYTTGTDLDGEAWASPPSIGCDEYHAGAVTGPLTVAMAAAYTNVAAGFPVAMTTRIDGRTTASAWDFGSGIVVSNQPYAVQSWAAPGDYPVILRAWNESLPGGVSATVTVHVVTAPVHYVAPASTNPVPPYTSWDTAATNLQDAVNALDADTVPGTWVLATNGTYAPVTVTRPAFLRSVNGPEFSIINGGGVTRCVDLAHGAGLFGFTLTNGYVSGYVSGYGGGVRCASANTWVSNCVMTGNWALGGGGAAWGTLDHCTLTGNWADGGDTVSQSYYGGGGAQGSILNHCTLSHNTANTGNGQRYTGGGGAADATLNYCTIYGNRATNSTAAIATGGGASFCVLNQCTIDRNRTDVPGIHQDQDRGGGAYASTLSHCTLTENYAGSSRSRVGDFRLVM